MIEPYKDGTLLRLYIQPGARKSGWDKVFDDRQKVKIKAPPRDGEANEELISFVAKSFALAKSKVSLVRGNTSRQKDLYLELDYEEALLIFKTFTTN